MLTRGEKPSKGLFFKGLPIQQQKGSEEWGAPDLSHIGRTTGAVTQEGTISKGIS